jgi:hypothetical protein
MVAKMGMMILSFDQSCLLHKQEQTTKTGPRDREADVQCG